MRTFFIQAESYGTGFEIVLDGIHYLITAAHLLGDSADPEIKYRLEDSGWKVLGTKFIGRSPAADIAVFEITDPGFTWRKFEPVSLGSAGLTVGQDMFFAGFPYKGFVSAGGLLKKMPLAFVKKGYLSAMETNPRVLYIDAINNEGFSGGPVFAYDEGKLQKLRIAAVVAGFQIQYEPVVDEQGELAGGLRVAYNTGFMKAYNIDYAVKLIRHATGSKEVAMLG